jgi:signal transduction histidine kinase
MIITKVFRTCQALATLSETCYHILMAEDATAQDDGQQMRSDLSRATSDFISVIAHKIHTPITSAKWQLEMLINEDLGTLTHDQKESLASVSQAAEQINDLSRALLYVFELEKDLPIMNTKEVNICELVSRATHNLENLSKEKGVSIISVDCDLRHVVNVDVDLAFVVLRTILENAIVYSPSGSEVRVTIKDTDEGIQICVDDRGCGIPTDQQNLVFTKFFRGTNAKKIWTDGTGLNLYVAKNIAKRTGGDLTFESRPHKGSTFCWRIPKKKKHKEPWER